MESQEMLLSDQRRIAKPAIFILLGAMFKRYATAAILSILSLFLHFKLGYDKNMSTTIFHAYEVMASCCAIVGAIIADSWLGIYKTIVALSVVFAAGSVIISIGVVDMLHLPMHTLSVVGLMLMATGDGCLKPINLTYGAMQYRPVEVKSIALFIVLFYFMHNSGSIISRVVTPILRQDVKCLGNDDCFSLAFGVSGLVMVLAVLLTVFADRYSETKQEERVSLLKVFGCIRHSVSMKIKSKLSPGIPATDYWLQHSEERYGKKLVWETRVIIGVIVLYVPLTFFWALFYQQGSRWVFQAVRMNGELGFYTIIPDQFNVFNPLMVLILIPIFENVLNPLLGKMRIRSHFQKTTLGGVLAGMAFLVSALVEYQIENGKYLHMAWLLPQYTLMAMGEILVTVPMSSFAYAAAPRSVKTVIQSFNNFAVGLGNVIVVVVVGTKLLDSQVYEFLLFAGLMFVNMIAFAFLAKRYKPLNENVDGGMEENSDVNEE